MCWPSSRPRVMLGYRGSYLSQVEAGYVHAVLTSGTQHADPKGLHTPLVSLEQSRGFHFSELSTKHQHWTLSLNNSN